MSTHANLSPSKAHRWLVCPGSIREEAAYPSSDNDSSPAAIDGTHSHYLLECCIIGGLEDPGVAIGRSLKDHEGEFTVDDDRAARVRVAIAYIKDRGKELGHDCEVIAEEKVNPQHFLGRDDLSGTVDVQIHAPTARVLEIIDYKDGMNYVPVEDNPQLELYGLGALAALKLPVNGDYPFSTVRLTVIQPKLLLKGGRAISWVEMPVRQLIEKISKYVIGAMMTDQADAPLVPGESQCKYCRAKGCSARASAAMKEAGMLFGPIMEQATEIAQQAADKTPSTMSNDQIRQLIEAAPLMRQLLVAAEDEAMRRFDTGVVVPGLKVVHGRGSRAWALDEDDIAEKLMKFGIPKASVYEVKLISPAKAEKITWKAKRNGTVENRQLTERQIKTLRNEYVTMLAGKLTVVPESDNRPAVVMNAAPLFGAVEEVPALPEWLS